MAGGGFVANTAAMAYRWEATPAPASRVNLPARPALTAGRMGPLRGAYAVGQLLDIQRTAGNAAAGLAAQRCGDIPPESCPCHGNGPAPEAVQRDTPAATTTKDPTDLSGTPFDSLDATLKPKLADQSVFSWRGKATLAEALNEIPNAQLAALSRVAAMISGTAPFLWKYVAKIGGTWVTDNFGVGIEWLSSGSLTSDLQASGNFCKDNPVTAKWYHGSTNAFRQIPSAPGAASLHVITGGSTDVHIDMHQPIAGKEKSWPFAGQCDLDLSAWASHAGDVMGGGGARDTAVGRFGEARAGITRGQDDVYGTDEQRKRLAEATRLLNEIMGTVQKYAAMGGMVGDEFEGDRAMLKDKATMGKLEQAEGIIRDVRGEQLTEKYRGREM